MSGWIKLHRNINNHWVWDNSDYLKWWLDIILEVNHLDNKVVIKNKIYDCKRGEKLYSLDTWAKRWNTNKSKVRRFLELLEKDNMIVLKNETQTTRLTVCKYDSYQSEENANETQTKRKRNANETHLTPIQECKNDKNDKNILLEKESKENSVGRISFLEYDSDKNQEDEKRKKVAPKKEKESELFFPFTSENFKTQWNLWKDYKSKEHKFHYKTLQSEQAGLFELQKKSNNNEEVAISIIHQSMANGWKGFFELKTNHENGKSNTGTNERFIGRMSEETFKRNLQGWEDL